MATTNGTWSRIGDGAFGLGLERYADPSGNPLWRLRVTRNPSDVVIDRDARASDLRKMIAWCIEAVKILETDGGRTPPPAPAEEEDR